MPRPEKYRTLWGLLGILFFLMLHYPLVQIANRPVLVAGVPLLVWYLFGVWVLAIGGLFLLSQRSRGRD